MRYYLSGPPDALEMTVINNKWRAMVSWNDRFKPSVYASSVQPYLVNVRPYIVKRFGSKYGFTESITILKHETNVRCKHEYFCGTSGVK